MELYYKNETLFVDVHETINETIANTMKKRIFNIIDDYDIDRIILKTSKTNASEKALLQNLEKEYKQKYNGNLIIK